MHYFHKTRNRSRLIAAALASPGMAAGVRAQCWERGPAHGPGLGLSANLDGGGTASTLWDPDGSGPLPQALVVSVMPFTGGRVQYWTGSAWSAIGNAFNAPVHDLEVYSGQLYACGEFSAVGSTPINGVARWNGSAWVQLGSGLGLTPGSFGRSVVWALHPSPNGLLFLGGEFYLPGSNTVGHCASWNGSSWANEPQTFLPIVSFCNSGGQMYCATGLGGGKVERYSAAAWTTVGWTYYANHGVYAVAPYQSRLIAGGEFIQMDGVAARSIAQLDGSTWAPLQGGLSQGTSWGVASALALYNGGLMAGGSFNFANGLPATSLARWNGVEWAAVTGLSKANDFPYVLDLEPFNSELSVLGSFDRAGPHATNNIARWNGENWLPFVEGINGRLRAFLAWGQTVYAGGEFEFTAPGGAFDLHHIMSANTAGGIATLCSIGGLCGVNGPINALAVRAATPAEFRMVAGGNFSFAGGVAASNIAEYNLTNTSGWTAMAAGLNGPVSAVKGYGSAFYAAGSFTASGTTPLPHLGRYSAGVWSSPGPWTFGIIQALAVYNNRLIIGSVDGGSNGVSAFDGTTLMPYGTANGPVNALLSFNGDLIAGGAFSTIGGVSAAGIARRSSATGQWSAMGAGLGTPGLGAVFALAEHDAELYAGGTFLSSGAAPVNRLARWTGSSWAQVRDGLDGGVYALASFNGRLQVGGDFNLAYPNGPGTLSPDWVLYLPHAYANCDNSTTAPVFNVNDFTCFLNRFAVGDSYANCDGSTTPPVLNVLDFTCFLNQFAVGCN